MNGTFLALLLPFLAAAHDADCVNSGTPGNACCTSNGQNLYTLLNIKSGHYYYEEWGKVVELDRDREKYVWKDWLVSNTNIIYNSDQNNRILCYDFGCVCSN